MPRPNRGPHLKPNKHGIYDIVHYLKGKPRPLSTGTKDPAAAAKALAAYINGDREVNIEGGWPVEEAWRLYKAEHLDKKPGADTERAEIAWQHLEPHFTGKIVQKLTVEDTEGYTNKRLMWVASSTVRRELSALVSAMNHLVKRKRMLQTELPYVPLPPNGEPRKRWLTAEEIAHLHATAEARRKRLPGKQPERLSRCERFLWIALQTGARRRVIEKLEWTRVNFALGVIDFNFGGPETIKKKPVVPISDVLRPVLERAYHERATNFVLDHSGSIRKAFDRMAAEAGMEDIHRHTLRHTWATHASMNGVDLVDIARVLGNSIEMVRKVYAHFQPQYLRRAVNFNPMSFAPPPPPPAPKEMA